MSKYPDDILFQEGDTTIHINRVVCGASPEEWETMLDELTALLPEDTTTEMGLLGRVS